MYISDSAIFVLGENDKSNKMVTHIHTKIIPLSEGNYTVGHDKTFHPFDESIDELTLRSKGSLLVEVQPFLVINDRDIILLDTGLGFKQDGVLILENNLNTHNIHLEDITKVLISHLHKDHSGGLYPSLFPNADIYIYRPEWEYALQQGLPSYQPDVIDRIGMSERIHWLYEEEGLIDDYIKYWKTGGHSKEHIAFLIEDQDGDIFYGGDEAPQLKQLKVRYKAKYDYDGVRALEWRDAWASEGKELGWRFLFYHDYKIPVSTL